MNQPGILYTRNLNKSWKTDYIKDSKLIQEQVKHDGERSIST